MTETEQLRVDLMYLARRMKASEDALEEWTEFMTMELLQNGIQLHKHKTSDRYFKESLKERFKDNYEKFESLFQGIKHLDKSKTKRYNEYNP